MGLRETIDEKMKASIREKDLVTVNTYRGVKAAITVEETKSTKITLDEAGVLAVVRRLIKQRKDSIADFIAGNRQDLVEKEQKELSILEALLPKQMSVDEIRVAINEIVATFTSPTIKDMGKVMKTFNEKYAGLADGKTVSETVKAILG